MYWGATLGASLPGPSPYLSPRPRRRPSSPKFVRFPLASCPGAAEPTFQARDAAGTGSSASIRTGVPLSWRYVMDRAAGIPTERVLDPRQQVFFAGKDRKELPSGSRRCGRGARGRPGWGWGTLGRGSSTPFSSRSPDIARRSLEGACSPGARGVELVAPAVSLAKVPLGQTVGFYPKTLRVLLACQSCERG
ncbi:hypothetical protein CapIbe_007272 [Capra ibex]